MRYILFCCVLFVSCDRYLDITPRGSTLLTTVKDYDQWLNDPVLAFAVAPPYCNLNYMGDNVDIPTATYPPSNVGQFIYQWLPQFSSRLDEAPQFWGDHYAKINKFNTVLTGIDQATGGTSAERRSLRAEALLGRAYEYFYLVNEYAQPYDSTTADVALAVPFVTSNDVSQVVPGRSTVTEIYTHILEDINTALPDLPEDNRLNRMRGSKAAGYSVLARVYFYRGDYTNASKYAAMALSASAAVMMNYNLPLPVAGKLSVRPDVIYGRLTPVYIAMTLDFLRSFAGDDLRVRMFYYSGDNYSFQKRGATSFVPSITLPDMIHTNTGTSVQEMKLIISEAAARSNDLAAALQQLDDVRKCRFAAASYQRYASADGDSVLQTVLQERAHELPMSGLRWFDMRRLDKENRMDTVYRYDAQGNVMATLPPHSPRYTLQIPVQVLSFNPGMPQNP